MIKTTTAENIDEMLAAAETAERRRTHRCLHASSDDPVQRLFVAGMQNTYFRPHRHPKIAETAVMVRGVLDILTFDDDGVVIGRERCSPSAGALTFDIDANVWHCGVVITESAVFFEAKPGPYDADTISEFADWAPPEGSPEAPAYQDALRLVRIGESARLG
jgi:cupin fold WbuC family metalloprotein